jgi:hypothetical protein
MCTPELAAVASLMTNSEPIWWLVTADDPAMNTGPLSAIRYSISVLYCMTTSLAGGGVGLGAAGLPEARLREFALSSGFGSVRRLPLENPFNVLYEIRL